MIIYRLLKVDGNSMINKNNGIFEIEASSVTQAW